MFMLDGTNVVFKRREVLTLDPPDLDTPRGAAWKVRKLRMGKGTAEEGVTHSLNTQRKQDKIVGARGTPHAPRLALMTAMKTKFQVSSHDV